MPEYKCTEPGCNKSFARQTLLNRHLKRLHEKDHDGGAGQFNVKVEGQDTYKCGACQAALDSAVDTCPHCGEDLNWS